jgi:hypothetical protein
LWILSPLCLAQIGETKEQLIHRYGPAEAYNPRLSSLLKWKEYGNVLDDICTFHPRSRDILVYFKRGKAVLFRFMHKDHSGMTNQELSSILNICVKKPDWVMISDGDKFDVRRWRTRDSSFFAYYFLSHSRQRLHSLYDGPRHSILVQTASVDAIYKKLLYDRYRSYGERRWGIRNSRE